MKLRIWLSKFISQFVYPFDDKARHSFAINHGICHRRKLSKLPQMPEKIPVFIISYNHKSFLAQCVEWLEKHGNNRIEIHIIDNKSTAPDVIEYLKNSPHIVHYMDKNWGPFVFWESGQFDNYINNSIYCLTDPDIAANKNLPDNWLDVLWRALHEYPYVSKVGFALSLDGLPDVPLSEKVRNIENRFWKYRLPRPDICAYFADIDTTFAMYRPKVQRYDGTNRFYKAIRFADNFSATHLPWFIDQKSPESQFYKKTAVGGGSWFRILDDEK